MRAFCWGALILAFAPITLSASPEDTGETDFVRRVLPVLRDKCFACHGTDRKQLKGQFDMTTRAALLQGGASGEPGLVPGKADASMIYRAVTRRDDLVRAMPPKDSDKLTQQQIESIRLWINGGAPWPSQARIEQIEKSTKASGVTVATSGGLTPEWTRRTYQPEDLWAYQPVRRPAVAESPPGTESIRHPIDAFIESRLQALGLPTAPRADRSTLIRRVTFDLTGLPPSPEERDAFVDDPATDDVAFAKVVDRLLASPHYGEQMARHWLDVTRYADSSGFANDYERGNAWRYRDYVVRSFNAAKPYRQFVMEQLAGDEIDPNNPEMLVATGFLRMGPWELTGMEVPKVARQRFLDDVTDAVGQVFLGHMLQCARCHDHKFDPVPTQDYYRLQAVFATTQLAERPAPFLPTENTAGFDERKYLDARRLSLEQQLRRIESVESSARAKWEKANPSQKGKKPPRHEFLPPADLGMERIARKGLERLKWEYDRFEPVAHSVYTGPTPAVRNISSPFRIPKNPNDGIIEPIHVLAGGDPFSPKDLVAPGVLSAVSAASIPQTVAGRRKALAEWITDPKNPLSARVMANRIWQWTMGIPLAGNPNNFGATGKKPTHPEVLDWLASELMDHGGSIKHVQRQILMSNAYRRSSRHPDPRLVASKDPTGLHYAVFRPRRLAAEELRDSLLAVSGELNRTVGGIPIRPEIHAEVAMQPRQVMGTFAPVWEPSIRPEQRHRRTIYALKLRGLRDPLLEVFDAPPSDTSCEARTTSNVASQSLALLNNETIRARALAFAIRLSKEFQNPAEAIDRAFRLAFGRPVTPTELAACQKHWNDMTRRHGQLSFRKLPRPTQITREAVEENTGVRFSFSEVLPSAADFVPDMRPSEVSPEIRGLMELCLVLMNSNEFIYLD